MEFSGQIDLTHNTGMVSINIKRPSGSAELSFTVNDISASSNQR
jgi:hypothetical protein